MFLLFHSYYLGSSSDDHLEERMDDLRCQMSLRMDKIRKMGALLREFANCEECIKNSTRKTPVTKSPVFTSVFPEPAKPHSTSTPTQITTPEPVRKVPNKPKTFNTAAAMPQMQKKDSHEVRSQTDAGNFFLLIELFWQLCLTFPTHIHCISSLG